MLTFVKHLNKVSMKTFTNFEHKFNAGDLIFAMKDNKVIHFVIDELQFVQTKESEFVRYWCKDVRNNGISAFINDSDAFATKDDLIKTL